MVNQHQRQTSVPHVRLTQPLPPLPLLHEIPPQLPAATQIPRDDAAEDEDELFSTRSPSQPPPLSIATEVPYQDNPENHDELLFWRIPTEPPRYEPMHDYLRARQQSIARAAPCIRPNPSPRNVSEEPYRDEPFVVTVVDSGEDTSSQPPPPAYNEIYQANEVDRQTLMREFDIDETPAERTEMLCRWVVAMLFIGLTVACVGTAFNWGRLTCTGGRC